MQRTDKLRTNQPACVCVYRATSRSPSVTCFTPTGTNTHRAIQAYYPHPPARSPAAHERNKHSPLRMHSFGRSCESWGWHCFGHGVDRPCAGAPHTGGARDVDLTMCFSVRLTRSGNDSSQGSHDTQSHYKTIYRVFVIVARVAIASVAMKISS